MFSLRAFILSTLLSLLIFAQAFTANTNIPIQRDVPLKPNSCLGAPFLYVSFHGKSQKREQPTATQQLIKSGSVNTIYRYSRDGCELGEAIDTSLVTLSELRGMVLTNDSRLLVANAYSQDSKIVVFGNCSADKSQRAYEATFTGNTNDTGKSKPSNLMSLNAFPTLVHSSLTPPPYSPFHIPRLGASLWTGS